MRKASASIGEMVWACTLEASAQTSLHGVCVAPGQQPPEIPRGFHLLPRR
jgi:hypothetical protein